MKRITAAAQKKVTKYALELAASGNHFFLLSGIDRGTIHNTKKCQVLLCGWLSEYER